MNFFLYLPSFSSKIIGILNLFGKIHYILFFVFNIDSIPNSSQTGINFLL